MFATPSEGGVEHALFAQVYHGYIRLSDSFSLWLAILKQPSPCVPGAHVENDESDPPQNRGVM